MWQIIYLLLVGKRISFMNHVFEFFFPMNHHWIVTQIDKIQKKIIVIDVHVWKKIYLIMYVIESYLRINSIFFPFGQISIIYEILKLMFVQCLQSSMG
jgi:hypothetical protein